ncbi:MAG: hypothetical protein Q9227_007763 [Pyrenula ochraceoflavens]
MAALPTGCGPIVRISPREVHIRDHAFFDKLYSAYAKLDKDPCYTSFANQRLAPFGTVEHDLHRLRRSAINKSFAPSSISRIQALLQDRTQALLNRLKQGQSGQFPVHLGDALKSFTTDVINLYALPSAPPHLEDPAFEKVYNASIRQILRIGFMHTQFPFIWQIMEAVPLPVLKYLVPEDQYAVLAHIDLLKRNAALIAKTKGQPPDEKQRKWPLILNEVYLNESLPLHEKSEARMTHEAQALTAAGGETTGSTLQLISYFLLKHPKKLTRLREEISTVKVLDDPNAEITSYKAFEKLPYLNACITEGLRIYTPVSGRLGRVNPREPTTYGKYVIPAGTVISMSIPDLHHDPSMFGPDPLAFKPERWLVEAEERRKLERHWAPFGRGARACAGQNLALAEMQVVLGNIFGSLGSKLELFETSYEDVGMVYEIFVPLQKEGSDGLKVSVKI